MTNKYVIFLENNHKEKEQFLFYLQYNGNEDELKKLNVLIANANTNCLSGDYSTFGIDITNFISENAANEHLCINLTNYSQTFTKCNGTFKLPTYPDGMTSNEIAIWLDEQFYACSIVYCFKC